VTSPAGELLTNIYIALKSNAA